MIIMMTKKLINFVKYDFRIYLSRTFISYLKNNTIYDNYFLYVKTTALLDEKEKYEIIKLLCKYITIFHNIHEDEIELALFTNNITQLLSN